MIKYFCFPFRFDRDRLKDDLARVPGDLWIPHFSKNFFKGTWSGVSLRSVGGEAGHIYSDPSARDRFRDTPLLDQCPYFREVMDTFECPMLSVRLLRLGAGSEILEHTDYNLDYEDGEVRIHVPVQTNPQMELYLDNERVRMEEGEAWYGNFSLPHRLANRGETDRIHMVLDCAVNDWIHGHFKAAGYTPPEARTSPWYTNHRTEELRTMLQNFRQMNSPASHQLADELEDHLTKTGGI